MIVASLHVNKLTANVFYYPRASSCPCFCAFSYPSVCVYRVFVFVFVSLLVFLFTSLKLSFGFDLPDVQIYKYHHYFWGENWSYRFYFFNNYNLQPRFLKHNTTQQNTLFNTIFDVFLCVISVSFSFKLFVPTLKSAFFSHYQRNTLIHLTFGICPILQVGDNSFDLPEANVLIQVRFSMIFFPACHFRKIHK